MSVRSFLYTFARVLGDITAASKGPTPYIKRRVRARLMAKSIGLLRRSFRKAGL